MYNSLTLTAEAKVALITLNEPKSMNALSISMIGELNAALDEIAAYLIAKETITGKEFMDIFLKVEGITPEELERRKQENGRIVQFDENGEPIAAAEEQEEEKQDSAAPEIPSVPEEPEASGDAVSPDASADRSDREESSGSIPEGCGNQNGAYGNSAQNATIPYDPMDVPAVKDDEEDKDE